MSGKKKRKPEIDTEKFYPIVGDLWSRNGKSRRIREVFQHGGTTVLRVRLSSGKPEYLTIEEWYRWAGKAVRV